MPWVPLLLYWVRVGSTVGSSFWIHTPLFIPLFIDSHVLTNAQGEMEKTLYLRTLWTRPKRNPLHLGYQINSWKQTYKWSLLGMCVHIFLCEILVYLHIMYVIQKPEYLFKFYQISKNSIFRIFQKIYLLFKSHLQCMSSPYQSWPYLCYSLVTLFILSCLLPRWMSFTMFMSIFKMS